MTNRERFTAIITLPILGGFVALNFRRAIDYMDNILKDIEQARKAEHPEHLSNHLIDCPGCGLPAEVLSTAHYFNSEGLMVEIKQIINCSTGQHPPILLTVARSPESQTFQ